MSFRVGSRVKWTWGKHEAQGQIVRRFTAPVTRVIKGARVTRNASEDDPAYLVKQEDGDRVLKSRSELSMVS